MSFSLWGRSVETTVLLPDGLLISKKKSSMRSAKPFLSAPVSFSMSVKFYNEGFAVFADGSDSLLLVAWHDRLSFNLYLREFTYRG